MVDRGCKWGRVSVPERLRREIDEAFGRVGGWLGGAIAKLAEKLHAADAKSNVWFFFFSMCKIDYVLLCFKFSGQLYLN